MRLFIIILLVILVVVTGLLYWSYQRIRSLPVERIQALEERIHHPPATAGHRWESVRQRIQKGESVVLKETEIEGMIQDFLHQSYPQYQSLLEGLRVQVRPEAVEVEALVNLQKIPREQLPREIRQSLKWYEGIFGSKALDRAYVKIRAIPQLRGDEIQLDPGSYIQIGDMKLKLQSLPPEWRRLRGIFSLEASRVNPYNRLILQDGQIMLTRKE